MSPAPPLMTVEEYFSKTPETVTPMELIYGALRVADAPTARHQMAVFDLARALDGHVRDRQIGRMWIAPLDVVLDEERHLIVQPDLFFISNERSWIVTDRVRGAPDLVIEVLSPKPRIGTIIERVDWFVRFGVRECWLLQQNHVTLDVLRFAGRRIASKASFSRGESIRSGVLPDFTLTLDEMLSVDTEPPQSGIGVHSIVE